VGEHGLKQATRCLRVASGVLTGALAAGALSLSSGLVIPTPGPRPGIAATAPHFTVTAPATALSTPAAAPVPPPARGPAATPRTRQPVAPKPRPAPVVPAPEPALLPPAAEPADQYPPAGVYRYPHQPQRYQAPYPDVPDYPQDPEPSSAGCVAGLLCIGQ